MVIKIIEKARKINDMDFYYEANEKGKIMRFVFFAEYKQIGVTSRYEHYSKHYSIEEVFKEYENNTVLLTDNARLMVKLIKKREIEEMNEW